jgi:hypothetical protein
VFYGVFIAAEIEGAGETGSVDCTIIDVEILKEAFLKIFLRYEVMCCLMMGIHCEKCIVR